MKPALGARVRDRVTKFEGTMTSHAKHLTGVDTVCITPTVDSDGKCRDYQWTDIDRVDVLDEYAPCGFVWEVECRKEER